MNRLFLTAALTTAFGLAAMAAGAGTGSYAGTWNLDKANSQGLSKRLETADKVTWTIEQDEKTISIDQKVEGGQGFGPPPGAGAGGAPGASGGPPAAAGGGAPRGPMAAMPPVVYNLDGTESTVTFDGDRGKGTLKAAKMGNGLQLSRNNVFNGPNGQMLSSETRKLELSGDGKVLTAIIHSENQRGKTDSTLVFNKQ